MAQSMEVDKRELTEALNKFIATSDKLAHMRDNTSNSTITVHGATGWQVTTCLCLAVLGMAFGAFGLYIAKETRDDMRAERQSREIMSNWTAQEVTAIRSYITNGNLQPMNPRPFGHEEEEKQ